MKKKKKVFILSDGRIYFNSVISFYKKSLTLLSTNDIFSSLNWIHNMNAITSKK